jgi:hypothetical protein
MDESAQDRLRFLIGRHILCGYLFVEYIFDLKGKSAPVLSSNDLYEMWIPSIYSASPLVRIEPRDKDEEQLQELWFGATGKNIRDHLQQYGAPWEYRDQTIITHYFYAGMLLRALEVRPLTKEEVLGISIGGAHERGLQSNATSPPQGCRRSMMMLLVVLALTGWLALGLVSLL